MLKFFKVRNTAWIKANKMEPTLFCWFLKSSSLIRDLKRQCDEIFYFRFFFVNQFPPSLSIPLRSFQISLTICGDSRRSRWTAVVVDTGGKFTTGINNTYSTGGKFTAGVVDTGGTPGLANISANFRKHLKYHQWFVKKTWCKNSCDTVPLIKGKNR